MTILARMTALGLALALSLSAPAHAAALALEPEGDVLPPTRLVVDTTGLGDTADVARSLLVPWIETELRDRHAVPLADAAEPDGATLTVSVSWARQMASDWKIELTVDDGSGPQKLDPFFCEGCGTEEEVADRIFEELPAAIALLRDEPASGDPSITPTSGPAAHGESAGPADDGAQPPGDRRERRPLGPLGKAGIPLMIVGVGAAVGGGVMIGLGERKGDSLTAVDRTTTDLRPPGIALVAIGGAVLVGGTVMLVIDRVRAKRQRTARAPSLVPMVSRRDAGVAFTFRF